MLLFKHLIMNQENSRTNVFFKFENLRIYHKSIDFANAIIVLSDYCHSDADRLVINMFANEALQITSNIIEGSNKPKDVFIEYLLKVKDSIGKCVALCTIAEKRQITDDTQKDDIRNELMELTKMVGALIVSLQKHEPENNIEL